MKIKKIVLSSILSLSVFSIIVPNVFAENETRPKSKFYNIDYENKIISRVEPQTTIEEFKEKIYIEDNEQLNIYMNNTKEEKITVGKVGTGMVAEYVDSKEQKHNYEISVIGDFNNDGELTQIELTNTIRHIVGMQDVSLTKLKLLSADITNDGIIDQRDITQFIRYIVTKRLNLEEPDTVAPVVTADVISKDTNSIKIKAVATDNERGMEQKPIYNFYIKKEAETAYTRIQSTKSSECNFSNLIENTNYKIKVTVEDLSGNLGETIISEKTNSMPEIKLTLTEKDKKITAIVSNADNTKDLSDIQSYTFSIKENKAGSSYITNEATSSNKCEFSNLTEARNYMVKVVAKDRAENTVIKEESILVADLIPPVVELSVTDVTSNSVSVGTTASDVGGMPETVIYEYAIKKKNDAEYTVIKETSLNSYTYTNLEQNTEYIIKVTTEDNAHNSSSAVQNVKTNKVKDLNEQNASFTLSEEKWTNKDVTVTINTEAEGYTIQTSKDQTNWINNATQVFSKNGTIYARLIDNNGQEGSRISKVISNIDKQEPTASMTLSNTTNSIKVNVTAQDKPQNNEYGISGLKGYYYSKDGGRTYTDITTNNYYDFINLQQTTDYEIKVKIEDNAGNIKEISELNTTETIPTGTITISGVAWNPNTHKASVNINTTATGFTLQYSVDDSPNWININSGNKTEEYAVGTTIYARLWDGVNESADRYASLKITDNEKPNAPTITKVNGNLGDEEWYISNEVSIKVSPGEDNQSGINKVTYTLSGAVAQEETDLINSDLIIITADGITNINIYTYDYAGNKSGARSITIKKDSTLPQIISGNTYATTSSLYINAKDATSGIIGYAVTENTVAPTRFVGCSNVKELNIQINDREQGKKYYVWVKDEAGHVSSAKELTTGTIPTGTITINGVAWNANTEKASVTITTTATGYKLQYSTNKENWIDITSGNKTAEYSVNTTIYARLFDGYNESSDTYASLKITENDIP